MLMDNYPDSFTMVQIHIGDSYATPWGDERASFYGVTGTPSAWFDGAEDCIGALNDIPAHYAWYHDAYTTRMAVPTDVTIEMSGLPLGGTTYEVTADVCVEPGGTARELRLTMVQVLDRWPPNLTYHRNGFKLKSSPLDITLNPGECQSVVRAFTFDTESMEYVSDIKIVAWAQEPDPWAPAEIHQSAYMTWPFPPPGGDPPARPMPDDAFDIDGTVVTCATSADCLVGISATSETYCIDPASGDAGPGTCYVQKNRYVSIDPNASNDGLITARRVSLRADGGGLTILGWLGAPVETTVGGPEVGPQLLSRVVDAASRHYRDWSLDDGGQAWLDATVHVGDCEISTGRTYVVQSILVDAAIDNESNYSEGLELATTSSYGDVVGGSVGTPPDGIRAFKDISAAVRGFQGAQTEPVTWLDLQGGTATPETPDFSDISFKDIDWAVKGFQGAAYPLDDPCTCAGLTSCP